MSRLTRGAVAIAAAIATALAGYAVAGVTQADASSSTLGPGLVTVNLGVHYSKFSIETVHVYAGTTVRFLIDNDDPIHHEFVVGDERVHARHRTGSEETHPPVPGEVSVGPNDVGVTFYEFTQPGRYEYVCHLPGHLAFGMRGRVVVEPRPESA